MSESPAISTFPPTLTPVATGNPPIAPAVDTSVGQLTRRLAKGDEEAFRDFHDRYFNRLYRYLLVLSRGQETEAREALQETFCRVVRYVRPFDDEEVFWCWLARLAQSAARDAGRKQQRYWNLLQGYWHRWRPVQAVQTDEREDELNQVLEGCLAGLHAEDRALLESKYVDGLSLRELGRQCGLTERAVESRLLRLRRHLRKRLLHRLHETSL